MIELLEALRAIRQAIDIGSNVAWFVTHNVAPVLDALRLFVFRTANPIAPGLPFTTVGPIQTFTPLAQLAADSGLTVATIWASFSLMWTRGTSSYRNQRTVRVLLPRLVLAVVLINFAVPLLQGAIDASNALSDSVALATRQQVFASAGEFDDTAGLAGLQEVVQIVLFASYAVLGFGYIIRFALLVILVILSPIAALLFVLPETHRYSRQWGALFVSALLMQPLQLLVIAIGFALDNYSILPIRHLFALASLFVAFKVPSALHSTSMAGTRAAGFTKRHVTHVVHAVSRV